MRCTLVQIAITLKFGYHKSTFGSSYSSIARFLTFITIDEKCACDIAPCFLAIILPLHRVNLIVRLDTYRQFLG